MTQRPLGLTFSALLLPLALAAADAWGGPPPHAPAHGWRKQHDPYYMGYTGHKWDNDYGIVSGRCNREEIGTVLGGVVGGAIGSQIGKGEGRMVATILGAVLGAVIGREIGRDMDEEDRACFGHTLELAAVGHTVVWNNPAGARFSLTPIRAVTLHGLPCREYTLVTSAGGRKETAHGTACLTSQGAWENAVR